MIFESIIYINSEGTSVFAQKLSAIFVVPVACFGKIVKKMKRARVIKSIALEKIFLVLIKSLPIEYIEAVGDFMKHFFDLFKELVPAYIEIRGRELVLLEGVSRIESYSETEIILASEPERILIKGESLCLCHLSSERVSVRGRVNGIEFI